MSDVVGLVSEVFTWVGFGVGALVLGLALLVKILDGTWLPTTGVVEETDAGPVMRWIDGDGNVNEAPVHPHDHRELSGRDAADIWYRRGWIGRMRLQPGSPAVRGILGLGLLLVGVGVVASIVQLVAMAIE